MPASILHRKKEGFSIPMKQWLRRELHPMLTSLLSPERVTRRGLFAPAVVQQMVAEHTAGTANHAHLLFCLMVFERWAEHHLDA